ncbi:hypothetical protein J4Q44_G00208460 [Coregonus suidteri]|uniref:Uncharacterized protein n=1 Tax=Coregonus suidteri TaxID=861788 RepID=A0AAN8LF70_9TELE
MISEAAFTSSGVGCCSLVSVYVNCPHPIPQVCCSLVALWFHREVEGLPTIMAARPVFSLTCCGAESEGGKSHLCMSGGHISVDDGSPPQAEPRQDGAALPPGEGLPVP